VITAGGDFCLGEVRRREERRGVFTAETQRAQRVTQRGNFVLGEERRGEERSSVERRIHH